MLYMCLPLLAESSGMLFQAGHSSCCIRQLSHHRNMGHHALVVALLSAQQVVYVIAIPVTPLRLQLAQLGFQTALQLLQGP